ncbi:MAG: hypothetical protein OHK005_13230 [Candidatus Methylacidiphilales bacterium]
MILEGRGRRWLAGAGLAVLLVQAGSFWLLWGASDGAYWSSGDVRFGDLAKHYGAGLFWREGRAEDLYQQGRLGRWLDELQREGKPREPASGTAGFNYVYAPLVAWVASWGSRNSYATFGIVWLAISLFAWIGTLVGLRELIGWRWNDPVVWLWAFTFPAAYYGLVLGQNHTVTLAVLVGVGFLLRRDHEVSAGLVLACLFYKPQWSVFLAVMLGLWGHGRVFVGWTIGTLVWSVLTLAVGGMELTRDWLGVVAGMETGQQNQVGNLNQTWRGLLATIFPALPGWIATAGAAVIWAVGAAWLGWARREMPPEKRRVEDLWVAAGFGVFAMPYVMHYDVVMMVPLWLIAICHSKDVLVISALIGTVVAGWLSINLGNVPVAWMAPVWTILFAALIRPLLPGEVHHDG